MNSFIDFILRNRTLVMIVVLLTALLGVLAWRQLPIDAFPDVTNQQVMVLTEAEGLGPEDIEQQVTIPVETVMGGLPGVRFVRSLSKTGLSLVVVAFDDKLDTYFVRQLVFERLALAREQLPPGVEPEHRRIFNEDYVRRLTPHFKSVEFIKDYLLVEAQRT